MLSKNQQKMILLVGNNKLANKNLLELQSEMEVSYRTVLVIKEFLKEKGLFKEVREYKDIFLKLTPRGEEVYKSLKKITELLKKEQFEEKRKDKIDIKFFKTT